MVHQYKSDNLTYRMLAPKTVVISVSNTRTDDCPAASVLQMVREKGCALYVTLPIPAMSLS